MIEMIDMNKVNEIIETSTLFFKDVEVELKKITWPLPNDAFKSTLAVIFISAILTLFLGSVDFVFSKVVIIILN